MSILEWLLFGLVVNCAISMSILLAKFLPSKRSKLICLNGPPRFNHFGSVIMDDIFDSEEVSINFMCRVKSLDGPLFKARTLQEKMLFLKKSLKNASINKHLYRYIYIYLGVKRESIKYNVL